MLHGASQPQSRSNERCAGGYREHRTRRGKAFLFELCVLVRGIPRRGSLFKDGLLVGLGKVFQRCPNSFFFHTLSKVTFFTCSTCASYIITSIALRAFLVTQSKVDISSNAKCQHETHSHRELAHASRTTLVYFVRCVCVVVNTVHCTPNTIVLKMFSVCLPDRSCSRERDR